MTDKNVIKELYKKCKELDIDDTIELSLNAESEEEREFIDMIGDFIMQSKQKAVIAQGKY